MRVIQLPPRFSFQNHGVHRFEEVLALFEWELDDEEVVVDLSGCHTANFQALALLVPYIWRLRGQGCHVQVRYGEQASKKGAVSAWKMMGAPGWSQVLSGGEANFLGDPYKPLLVLRNRHDLTVALEKIRDYTEGLNIEYEKILHKIVSELLYNALEHGRSVVGPGVSSLEVPPIVQCSWYRERNELSFLVADVGIGIKRHMEQYYSAFADHGAAIRKAMLPYVSGTFGIHDPYYQKDNQGLGLYISSHLMQELRADMYIVSGDGVVHVSPRDVTSRSVVYPWPGTLVLLNLRLRPNFTGEYAAMLDKLRAAAQRERDMEQASNGEGKFYVHMANHFGRYAEDKDAAIAFRDQRLLPEIMAERTVVLDFDGVRETTHSFLGALLATPIRRMGLLAYKRLRVVNAPPDIRATIDFILDDNT